MAGGKLTIGDLAARNGTKVQIVRYYEQVGILPKPARGQTRLTQAPISLGIFP